MSILKPTEHAYKQALGIAWILLIGGAVIVVAAIAKWFIGMGVCLGLTVMCVALYMMHRAGKLKSYLREVGDLIDND